MNNPRLSICISPHPAAFITLFGINLLARKCKKEASPPALGRAGEKNTTRLRNEEKKPDLLGPAKVCSG